MIRTFNSFSIGMVWRVSALFLTLAMLAWVLADTSWYITIAVLGAAALGQGIFLVLHATATNREIARFLDAIAYEDALRTFSGPGAGAGFPELRAAMGRLLERLRVVRREREEQARYFEAVVSHLPVPLLSIESDGGVRLLNLAARRLFGDHANSLADFSRYGTAFANSLSDLQPGRGRLITMERGSQSLQLKAAATKIVRGGEAQRLVSLSNIGTELSAQELAAWQAVIRVLAHEIMNSLTPISSLSATAQDLVCQSHDSLPADHPLAASLADARTALETVARRCDGLLQFVETYRHLSRRLVARVEPLRLRRVFARIERLLAAELAARGILLGAGVEPESLELAADPELLDQALINLLRNAMEALKATASPRIVLKALRGADNRIAISVSDNGPGIAPELRETVFVPFFTTKRDGTGIGLTLSRQIAVAHGAALDFCETEGGGATFVMRFG